MFAPSQPVLQTLIRTFSQFPIFYLRRLDRNEIVMTNMTKSMFLGPSHSMGQMQVPYDLTGRRHPSERKYLCISW